MSVSTVLHKPVISFYMLHKSQKFLPETLSVSFRSYALFRGVGMLGVAKVDFFTSIVSE